MDDGKVKVGSTYSGDVASVFTGEAFLTQVTCVTEVSEKGKVETWEWMKKSEVVEKDDYACSVWDVTPEEDYFRCKKGKEVKVKVCA